MNDDIGEGDIGEFNPDDTLFKTLGGFTAEEEEKEFDNELGDADDLDYLNLEEPTDGSMFSGSMFLMLAMVVIAGLIYRKKRKNDEDQKPKDPNSLFNSLTNPFKRDKKDGNNDNDKWA